MQTTLGLLWIGVVVQCTPDPQSSNGYQPVPTAATGSTAAAGQSAKPGASAGSVSSGTGGVGSPTPAGAPGARAGNAAPATAASGLPCAISKLVTTKCHTCHGKMPIGGAPMSLVTFDDFHQAAKTKPALKVFELVKTRIHDQASPMPQGGLLQAAELQTFDAWLDAGAVAAGAADASCSATTPTSMGEGSGDGSFGPISAAPGETCYEFETHQSTTSVDHTPYDVGMGEHYEQFYFKVPWPKGTVATRYGTRIDNAKVLHHWLLFSTTEDQPDGAHITSPLPTLQGSDPTLLSGWAVGGSNLALPDDVGLELPDPGTQLNVQWHFYNSTGMPQTDHSFVQVCTIPAGTRPHTASMTWMGTEDLGGNKWLGGEGMPAHKTSVFTGTCDPLREGMNSTDPIHIIAFWPHMHKLGTNLKTVVNHQGGLAETIFDKPFDFNHQIHYMTPYALMPGDTVTSSCTFNNTTDEGVPFGESSDSEMCYQFTFSWPAHSLENHAFSLLGSTNTCWE